MTTTPTTPTPDDAARAEAERDALRLEVGILQTTLRDALAAGETHKRMHADACDEIGKLAATIELHRRQAQAIRDWMLEGEGS